jgi:hypothetical protein
MVELDVSIDTFCSFDNILAICVNKSGKTFCARGVRNITWTWGPTPGIP